MLSRLALSALRSSSSSSNSLSVAARGFAAAAAGETKEFALRNPAKVYLLEDTNKPIEVSSKDELMTFFKQMYTIRRMEIACDTEYKARNIRGFCHLYDGQEAIAAGMQAALSKDDDVMTAYRCHGIQYIRGDTVKRIVGELLGFSLGSSKGKGGSMHFYSKANRFWGGSGIVGAQVPVGAGLAFANMYRAKKNWPNVNISVAMFGDGASNQGQVYEAANMAKLWSVPTIFVCENNQYGMGTSSNRSSANTEYYKMGGVVIPGIQCDGMDVLAVKQAFSFARDHCKSGKGPIFLEAKTYRYHGHSMSDPGITYRNRDEVTRMRESRDCIEQVKGRIVEAGWATQDELKAMEKEIRTQVQKEVDEAKQGSLPPAEALFEDILWNEKPNFIRGAIFEESKRF